MAQIIVSIHIFKFQKNQTFRINFSSMKTKLSLLLTGFFTIGILTFTGCGDDDGPNPDPNINTGDTEVIADEEEVEAIFEDLEELTNDALTEAFSPSGGRLFENFMTCAEVSLDLSNKSLTVDFGEGCEGPRGRLRKGKIMIAFSGSYFESGAVITTTFQDFEVDGLKIEGTRTVTNTSGVNDNIPKFSVTVTGGKVIWPDGTFATREANRTKSWIRAATPLNDEFQIEGTANGVTRTGRAYTTTITEKIIFRIACANDRIFLPVQGTKEIEVDGSLKIEVDYGDGACDNTVTITKGDDSREIDVTNVRQG